MAKRLTDEELENDPLLENFSRMQNFYSRNKAQVIGGILAVILIVGGAIAYYLYSQSQEEQARQLMARAEIHYMNQQYEAALMGSEAEFTVGFEQIIANYPRTDAANLARYYAAVSEFNLGNTEQALEYMDDFDVPYGILGVGPISFRGVLLTELERHEEAGDTYVRAAEWDRNQSTTPYNYLEAAQSYLDAGNTDQARRYAETVVDDYPQSDQVTEANRILGMIAAR